MKRDAKKEMEADIGEGREAMVETARHLWISPLKPHCKDSSADVGPESQRG